MLMHTKDTVPTVDFLWVLDSLVNFSDLADNNPNFRVTWANGER